jgi:hypothetical protein
MSIHYLCWAYHEAVLGQAGALVVHYTMSMGHLPQQARGPGQAGMRQSGDVYSWSRHWHTPRHPERRVCPYGETTIIWSHSCGSCADLSWAPNQMLSWSLQHRVNSIISGWNSHHHAFSMHMTQMKCDWVFTWRRNTGTCWRVPTSKILSELQRYGLDWRQQRLVLVLLGCGRGTRPGSYSDPLVQTCHRQAGVPSPEDPQPQAESQPANGYTMNICQQHTVRARVQFFL